MLHLCLWNTKKFSKALIGTPIRFLITKNEELASDLELFFSKKLKQTISQPLPVLLRGSFTSNAQRTFVALQFAHPMTQK
jgi:hypothetical protein